MSDKAIYDIITENLVDGELPENFYLPSDSNDKLDASLRFADGAADGIVLYHVGRSQVSEGSMALVEKLMCEITDGDFDAAFFTLCSFSETNTALGSIDEFEGYILDNTDWIDPTNLYGFATECLITSDKEIIKFGLEMMEIFTEPNDGMKNFMRTLGLSDEFTLFVLFNIITNWSNANDEIFKLAKKTHGWGRIHAVERLLPETEEIKKWLLHEGINNRIMGEYSAHAVFRRVDVGNMLKEEKLSHEDFYAIRAIVDCLLNEAPISGFSSFPNSDEILTDFLNQAKNHKLNIEVVNTVFQIAKDERFESLKKDCDEILKTESSKRLVRRALREGKAFSIAKYLNIYSPELIYKQMVDDFDKYFHNCGLLVKNDEYRDKVLELFREKLPLDKMENDSEQNYGLGREYKDYTALVMLISELKNYPMCGVDFIKLGLISPVANNRTMAISVLCKWCDIKKCKLPELSKELADTVLSIKEKVHFDNSKEIFEHLGV